MTTTLGKYFDSIFGAYLTFPNLTGITGSIQQIQDGSGTASALGLSTAQVNCASITFNGTTIALASGSTLTVTPDTSFTGTVSASAFRGPLTGNVTGTLTGSITGNAATVTTIPTLSGDVSNSGNVVTLDTVNTNVGTFQGITVNDKGLVTGATAEGYTTNTGTVTSVTGSGLASGTVTTTGDITVTASSASIQNTGTDLTTAVTPGQQYSNPSSTKAWANISNVGTVTIQDSFGVASATHTGAGQVTITLSKAMVNTSYAVSITCQAGSNLIVSYTITSTTVFVVNTFPVSGAAADNSFSVLVHGHSIA